MKLGPFCLGWGRCASRTGRNSRELAVPRPNALEVRALSSITFCFREKRLLLGFEGVTYDSLKSGRIISIFVTRSDPANRIANTEALTASHMNFVKSGVNKPQTRSSPNLGTNSKKSGGTDGYATT